MGRGEGHAGTGPLTTVVGAENPCSSCWTSPLSSVVTHYQSATDKVPRRSCDSLEAHCDLQGVAAGTKGRGARSWCTVWLPVGCRILSATRACKCCSGPMVLRPREFLVPTYAVVWPRGDPWCSQVRSVCSCEAVTWAAPACVIGRGLTHQGSRRRVLRRGCRYAIVRVGPCTARPRGLSPTVTCWMRQGRSGAAGSSNYSVS